MFKNEYTNKYLVVKKESLEGILKDINEELATFMRYFLIIF